MSTRVQARISGEGYFEWLKEEVEYFDERGIHNFLLKRLYEREFYLVISRDENRAEDGVALRDDYFRGGERPEYMSVAPCSFLEFLVALARRMNFAMADSDENLVQMFFWEMIANMGLRDMDDAFYFDRGGDQKVDQAIDTVLERTYDAAGNGGLFPLKYPRFNQRNTEIWYQMQQYCSEMRSR